jgi:hypothetical protein
MIIDAMLLPVPFDNQPRFSRSVGFGLEYPFAANHMIPGWDVLSPNLFPCFVLEKRRVFFLDGGPPLQSKPQITIVLHIAVVH